MSINTGQLYNPYLMRNNLIYSLKQLGPINPIPPMSQDAFWRMYSDDYSNFSGNMYNDIYGYGMYGGTNGLYGMYGMTDPSSWGKYANTPQSIETTLGKYGPGYVDYYQQQTNISSQSNLARQLCFSIKNDDQDQIQITYRKLYSIVSNDLAKNGAFARVKGESQGEYETRKKSSINARINELYKGISGGIDIGEDLRMNSDDPFTQGFKDIACLGIFNDKRTAEQNLNMIEDKYIRPNEKAQRKLGGLTAGAGMGAMLGLCVGGVPGFLIGGAIGGVIGFCGGKLKTN